MVYGKWSMGYGGMPNAEWRMPNGDLMIYGADGPGDSHISHTPFTLYGADHE